MNIFIVIVTYNGMKWIEYCLSSIESSTVGAVPVVIDNCSTDGTADFVEAHFPQTIILRHQKNLGFGQANNVGIRYAMEHDAHYVMLLNQDAYLAPDALQNLVKSCTTDCLLSPLHLNGDGTALDLAFKNNTIKESTSNIIDNMFLGNRSGVYDVPFVNAACWFLPISVIKRVGGFNPIFFHYGEDMNYVHRLQYHGIPVRVCPAATVRHDRLFVGNAQVFAKGRTRRELLIEACNINHTFLQRMKKYVRIFLNHNSSLFECLKSILWLAFKSGIRKSRISDMAKTPQWL